MVHRLRYGYQSTIDLHPPPEVRIASRRRQAGLADPVTAVIHALQNPLGYPSLHLATTPGDQVVIALDPEVPEPAAMVVGLVNVLHRGGVEPSDVTVLFGHSGEGECQALWDGSVPLAGCPLPEDLAEDPATWLGEVRVEYHDPRDRAGLAYLAATREGTPIYLNRLLVDADLVIPVSPVRLAGSPGYLGVFGSLLPLFSDEETNQRFRYAEARGADRVTSPLQSECDEVAWLLGSMLAVQVVAGSGDSIQSVVAGAPAELDPIAQQKAAETWTYSTPFQASLVIATIAGGPNQQTWSSIARALFAASQAAGESSDIVLCTELRTIPQAVHNDARPFSARGIDGASPSAHSDSAHSEEAWSRHSVRDPIEKLLELVPGRSRLFLLSQLSSEVVEDLGWGHIATAEEIQRLAERHDSWILLEDAQYLSVTHDDPS